MTEEKNEEKGKERGRHEQAHKIYKVRERERENRIVHHLASDGEVGTKG